VPLIGADAVGGAAYIYLGRFDSTYNTTPYWDLHANISPLLGVNGSALIGNSVAGAGYIMGNANGPRSLVGGASNALDFGVGLLNLNNTLGTTFDFVFDNNGLGKAYTFSYANCNATLPISLLDFKGRAVNKTVPLDWKATTATNFSHFELQRSIDGINYEPIAVVLAKNENLNDYTYTDRHPYTGINYYRLKLIDNDAHYTYSSIVVVRFEDKVAADIVIAPNPVQHDIIVKTTGLEKGMYQAELMNNSGQVFMTKTLGITQYMQTTTITRQPGMAAGIYWLNIYDNTNRKITSLRILLQ
jgi:hypothetical protein